MSLPSAMLILHRSPNRSPAARRRYRPGPPSRKAQDTPHGSPSTNSIYDTTDGSQDGDAGWIRYSSKGTITLLSPIVDITTLTKPTLKFWYKAIDGVSDEVTFEVAVSGDRGITRTSKFSTVVAEEAWTPVRDETEGMLRSLIQ